MLEIKNISKFYNGKPALSNVTFSVASDEIMSILGPSGSGKSTLLRIIAGLEEPDSGSVCLDGVDLTTLAPEKRQISLVFQDPLLFPKQTIAENVGFPLRFGSIGKEEVANRIKWALGVVRLEDREFGQRYRESLSGGEAQRAALARGITAEPRVMLFDEPLANLDRVLRKELEIELRDLQRELGVPFVFVTHNQEEALTISDRLLVLRGGSVEQVGTALEVYNKPASAFVAFFLGNSNRFDGKVRAADETMVEFEWEDEVLHAPKPNCFSEQMDISYFVRQEKVAVSSSDIGGESEPDHNSLLGQIRDITFRGQLWDLVVQTRSGSTVIASTSSIHENFMRIGANIRLTWQASTGHTFSRPSINLRREVE